jgi:serine/threonine-protein phosphatase 6 regulatory subunit 3
MGHLTLISEDVITTLEHFPPDLRQVIEEYAPQPAWDEYVRGRYKETKKKDTSLLGGGKPTMTANVPRPAAQWKVDEEDSSASVAPPAVKSNLQETKGEFRRVTGSRPALTNTADFGVASTADDDDDDDDDFNTATHPTYLAHEMQPRDEFGGSSSSDASDEEEGWLAQSRFDMQLEHLQPSGGSSPVRERRPLSEAAIESAFPPPPTDSPFNDPFSAEEDDDDSFGPFSDSAAASRSDPFNLSASFSDDIQEVSFDSFGDFGDFQSGGDGETTPTAGSWTFASGSSHSSPSDAGDGSGDEKDADAKPTREVLRDP